MDLWGYSRYGKSGVAQYLAGVSACGNNETKSLADNGNTLTMPLSPEGGGVRAATLWRIAVASVLREMRRLTEACRSDGAASRLYSRGRARACLSCVG